MFGGMWIASALALRAQRRIERVGSGYEVGLDTRAQCEQRLDDGTPALADGQACTQPAHQLTEHSGRRRRPSVDATLHIVHERLDRRLARRARRVGRRSFDLSRQLLVGQLFELRRLVRRLRLRPRWLDLRD